MRKLLSFALALALCLSLAGCWDAEASETPDFWEVEPEEPPAGTVEPVKVTEFTLPYLNSQTFDPIACSDGIQQTVASLLYEGLFTLDEHFVPQPCLCSSYDRSNKGLTYSFWLREDVTFSDGSAFTASDVLAAYRRAQVSDRYAARFSNVASMHVSRGALVVTLKQADSALPALFDIPVVKAGTEKDTVPLGTGAYYLQSEGEACRLVRREHWWRDGSNLPAQIALTPAKSEDAAVYLFSAEQAHLLTADLLGESSASALGGVDLADAPTATMLFLGFNTKKPLLASSGLRAVMNTALDRDAIVASLLANHAAAAQFPISPASPLYPAALDKAFESGSYAAALAANGESAPVELRLLVNAENGFKTALAEYLARQLTAAHITVTPVVLPWGEYLAALQSGDFDLWLGEVRLTVDWNFAALAGTGGALNYGKFSSAELDKALAAFLASENESTASALCERFAAEAPFLPLAFKSVTVLTPSGVIDGVSPTAAQPLRGLERWQIHIPA